MAAKTHPQEDVQSGELPGDLGIGEADDGVSSEDFGVRKDVNMVAEPGVSSGDDATRIPNGPNATGDSKGKDFFEQFKEFMNLMRDFEERRREDEDGWKRRGFMNKDDKMSKGSVVLDEKYFRRMEKFEGDSSKFRGWLFDLLVAIGQVDKDLVSLLRDVMEEDYIREVSPEDWKPEMDSKLDLRIYSKFKEELFGLLVSLTSGEAKGILKGMSDARKDQDGFRALRILQRRYDSVTTASLLQAYLEVVAPPGIKGMGDIVAGIHKWETKVALLSNRFKEDINDRLKVAIAIGMMPKDYQDMVLQRYSSTGDIRYDQMRDYVIGVAQQKIQMRRPTPMDVGYMEFRNWSEDFCGYCEDYDVDMVGKAGIQCYKCGGFGHVARECPIKGLGKGDP